MNTISANLASVHGPAGSCDAGAVLESVIALTRAQAQRSGVSVERAGFGSLYTRATGHLCDLPGTTPICQEDLLALPCHVLIPAALEGAITCDNAEAVRARIVMEAANMPVTHMADGVLRQRGVVVAPNILANAGGVIASYFEWVQNIQQFPWDLDTVLRRLESCLSTAYEAVRTSAREMDVDLRTAAYEIAVHRVLRAIELRGF